MLAAVLAALLAQQPSAAAAPQPAPAPTGLILGRVVEAGTGRPIGGATINWLTAPPDRDDRRIIADAQGRFVIRAVAAGQHRFGATAPGYIPGEAGHLRPLGPGQPVTLADGEKTGDVAIRLWKTATLSGAVYDDAGEPVGGVWVRAMRRSFSGGRARFAPGPVAQTDDRGVYRLANLTPGDFIVAILTTQVTVPVSLVYAYEKTVSPGGAANQQEADMIRRLQASGAPQPYRQGVRVGEFVQSTIAGPSSTVLLSPAPMEGDRSWIYPAAFFPSGAVLSQATVLTLASGDDRSGIDIRLRLVPGVRVSGSVNGPDGTPMPSIGVRLVPENADHASDTGIEIATTATDAAGRFTFVAVPAGSYILKVTRLPMAAAPPVVESSAMIGIGGGAQMAAPSTAPRPAPAPSETPLDPLVFASMPLAVGDRDVAEVVVALQTSARASGRIEFDGTAAKPAVDQLLRMAITLQSVEAPTVPAFTSVPPGRATADGAFTTASVAPGKYVVSVSSLPPGWTVKSAMLNGRDVADVPFELGTEDVTGIILYFGDRTAELSGTATTSQGRPDPDAEILIFPADTLAWREFGVNLRRARNVRASKTGSWAATGLPAGEYFVAAVTGLTTDWQDPRLLDSVARTASRVTLAVGEKKVQNLRSGPIR